MCIFFFLYLVSGSVFRLRSEQDAIIPRTHTRTHTTIQRRAHARLCIRRWCQLTAAGTTFHTCRETHVGHKVQADGQAVAALFSPASPNFSPSFSLKVQASDPAKARVPYSSSFFLLVFINFASPLSVSTLNNQC